MYRDKIEKLFRENLNIKKGERVLIFTDRERDYYEDLLNEFVDVAKSFTSDVRYMIYEPTKVHGHEPPVDLWRLAIGGEAVDVLIEEGFMEKIVNKDKYSAEDVLNIIKRFNISAPDVVVAFPYYSTTHTFFRKLLTDNFGARYASMPLFEPEMFLTSMDVDWYEVASLSRDISDILTEATWVHVKSDYGTDIEFSIEGRKAFADTGLFHNAGDFGNLPAGEGFIAPVETEAYGKLVIIYGPDRKLERPITFKFNRGGVEDIEGFEEYRYYIEDIFKKMPEARYIAEFGVGTNPKASRADNILEAEKIRGTIHIAIGDNHTFGGMNRVSFHTDYVVFEPTVVVGGKGWEKKLLEKGNLMKI